MNEIYDLRALEQLQREQRGVFSKADLQTALAEPHPAAFARRVSRLLDAQVLRRFVRGWYVTEAFDLEVLSQRLAPASCVSFGAVLASELLIGVSPARRVTATKVGRGRAYRGLGCEVVHVSIDPTLCFGCRAVDGVRRADPEKAALDSLYFHLRGRKYVFDIYSDIQVDRLDVERLKSYLARYRNPRFRAFAADVLGLR